VEQERLKQALERLIEAQLEALDVIAERSEPNVEDLEEDRQTLVGVRLEAALEEVRAILEEAQENVRGTILGAKESRRDKSAVTVTLDRRVPQRNRVRCSPPSTTQPSF
jgi:hypothetical protein